ncbi:hypothetical protein E2I00_001497, partial [Balaenoptera physalus]
SEDREEIQEAVRACSRLFGALLARGELFVGQLPSEEMVMAGSRGATRKYRELALSTLMKFVQLEGQHPLEKPKWEGNYLFPHQLFKRVGQAAPDLTCCFRQLPLRICKKVLVITHDSILPHLAQPSLMIDFLARACDLGEQEPPGRPGARAGLGEYPDFYRKLYGLLDPSVFHVKYRARFFHLADLFLSSSHLPAYLVAAFTKRLARLALTAPPEALLTVLPFICNLLRRHPACCVLVHRPRGPGECGRSPWEAWPRAQHVSKAASAVNQALSEAEVSIAPLLELTAFQPGGEGRGGVWGALQGSACFRGLSYKRAGSWLLSAPAIPPRRARPSASLCFLTRDGPRFRQGSRKSLSAAVRL